MRRSPRSTSSRPSLPRPSCRWRPRSASTARRCSGTANSASRPSPGCAAAHRSSMRPRRGRSSGAAVARLHQIGARRPFAARPRIGVQRLGWEARAQVLGERAAARGAARALFLGERRAARACERGIRRRRGRLREIRMHGDCHLGNLLWNEHGPVFVDLDDCAMGPRVQDLWMMLSGSPAEQQRQWQRAARGLPAVRRLRLPGGHADRAPAGAAHAPPRRLGGRIAGLTPPSPAPSPGSASPATGRGTCWTSWSRSPISSSRPSFRADPPAARNADSVRAPGSGVALLCSRAACMRLNTACAQKLCG